MEVIRETIGRMLEKRAEGSGTKDALIHLETGLRYTYGLLLWDVDRIARGLLKLGLRKGDRVALWAPNVPEWITAQLSLATIGAVLVPVNPGAQQDDLHYILSQTKSRAIIMAKGIENEEYVDMALGGQDRLADLKHIIVFGDTSFPDAMLWSELGCIGEDVDPDTLQQATQQVNPEDPVAIMYTSGTTGRPKGVVLDHVGLINKSICASQRHGLGPEDRLCLFFPLYHMFGNTCIALTALLAGATIIMPCSDFDPPAILSAIGKEHCTAVYGSPSMFSALLEHPQFKKKAWASVKKGIVGGAPCPRPLMERLVGEIGVTGVTVGYGITEASSWITMTQPDDPIELRVSTIGRPLECNEVKIIDPETGKDRGPREKGELCTRGFLMKGYYNMPAATASAIDGQGWFHTGDMAVMDEDGYVRLVGRVKEVIIRDGVEIYPVEVEEVIHQMPEVLEVQVFGFRDTKGKDHVAAWVRLKQGAHRELEQIRKRVEQQLPAEKVPDYFKVVNEFPVTKSGKVQKFRLAQMAEKEYQ
ncbi:MAG: AMP-binding protein [Deltaproteobacteria bacterium]|nr:MAG: AMP-binding protein [Deltaproteobacteria bacterium]